MTEPLTSEQIDVLRSLPRWNGPGVAGAPASETTDTLVAAGVAIGSDFDRPFDEGADPDAEPRLVWRNEAGDTLLATLEARDAEINGLAEKLAQASGEVTGELRRDDSWHVYGDHTCSAEGATFIDALSAAEQPGGDSE